MFDVRSLDLELILGEKSRRSLKHFIQHFWQVLEPSIAFCDNWHLDCFCSHLTHIDQCRNLLVNCPPNVSKSLIFTVFYPAWKWIQDPSYRFLFASYALKLAERDSQKCRRLIGSPLFQKCFPHVAIDPEKDTNYLYHTTKTGFRQSISVGSATKGYKGQFICVDDPHDSNQATSDIVKADTISWFQDGFLDRLCDFNKDNRCVVGQRICRGDLSEFILNNYASNWTHINLPWEYKPTSFVSPIGWLDPRKVAGEPLNPARFPENEIAQLRKKTRTWACQWNQNPTDSADSLFKSADLRHYTETPTDYVCDGKRIGKNECWKLMACDLAYSLSDRADYTVFVIGHLARTGEIIIVDVFRDRIPTTKITPMMAEYFNTHRPAYVICEDVAFQRVIIDQAKLDGIPVRGIKPEGDKETRSIPMQARMEQHQLWLPQHAPWLSVVEQEILEFPNGSFDDCVDAISQVASEAGKRNRTRPEAPQEAPKPKSFAPGGRQRAIPGLMLTG